MQSSRYAAEGRGRKITIRGGEKQATYVSLLLGVCVQVALLLLFLWPCAISFLPAIQPSPNENHLRFVHALPLDGNKK